MIIVAKKKQGEVEMEKVNVAIADDNERMVALLDEILSKDEGIEVVGCK